MNCMSPCFRAALLCQFHLTARLTMPAQDAVRATYSFIVHRVLRCSESTRSGVSEMEPRGQINDDQLAPQLWSPGWRLLAENMLVFVRRLTLRCPDVVLEVRLVLQVSGLPPN